MDYDWTLEESKKLAAAELPLAMQAASGTIDLSLRLIASASMPEQKKEAKQRKRQAQAAEPRRRREKTRRCGRRLNK